MTSPDPIATTLLEILQCPIGKSPLKVQGGALVCACGLSFPIVDEIPVLILERASLPAGIHSQSELPCMKARP